MAIELGDAVLTISGDASNLDGALNKIKPSMKQLGIGMTVVGGAITGAFGMATAKAMDFNSKMANVATLGVTNLNELKVGVKDLAVEMGIGATQAATDLY
ncbi:hypothetical protein KAR91_79225, partial [Candidatus Pacearchaeota archaeon]|nr:hypothetical protein [Candidatus Pacearchaeota archaeon]